MSKQEWNTMQGAFFHSCVATVFQVACNTVELQVGIFGDLCQDEGESDSGVRLVDGMCVCGGGGRIVQDAVRGSRVWG